MKRLILLRGPMGVGKTATGRELQRLLPQCAFLDGDWCWDIRPLVAVRERTNSRGDRGRFAPHWRCLQGSLS